MLATGAYQPLLRRIRNYFVPVYDYVLVTEPLSAAQLASLGWRNRQGAADAGNQFHYFRLTDDNRVLWGGFDAVYFNGSRVSPAHDQRPATFVRLAEQFFTTFPQLDDVAFSYAWGGAIDTCSRSFAYYRTATVAGSATREGTPGWAWGPAGSPRTCCWTCCPASRPSGPPYSWFAPPRCRSRPKPFAVIQLTRASLARADRAGGRRNLWLRTLDRLGLGFRFLATPVRSPRYFLAKPRGRDRAFTGA